MENGMSPADLSALMGNRDGFGNGGAWWIIILFLFLMGGNGWNRNNGELNQYATAASQQQILFNQQFDALGQKINQIGDGICSSTYALNNSINGVQTVLGGAINTEGRNLQMQLADSTCKIENAIHAEGEATRNLFNQFTIQSLRDRVASLEADSRMCGVVRYPMSYTYSAGNSPFCGCNCGNI